MSSTKREFLMLAHTYREAKHGDSVVGWMMSEKLDGMRAFWDGGLSRGVASKNLPYSNTLKDGRKKHTVIATGLWSRFGNVINAPDWFLDQLPSFPLDGELLHSESRQKTLSIVKKDWPDHEWHQINYYVFESPPIPKVFSSTPYRAGPKEIINIDELWLAEFLDEQIEKLGIHTKHIEYAHTLKSFTDVVQALNGWDLMLSESRNLKFLKQEKVKSMDHLYETLARTRAEGGEGLMLRKPGSFYECKRSHNLLKLKNISFGTGTVMGYTTGRETDRGSKLLGLMGNVAVEWKGKCFEISGFTDQERELVSMQPGSQDGAGAAWARANPDSYCPLYITSNFFPRGSEINFTYRGLTKDGIPNEARYRRTK